MDGTSPSSHTDRHRPAETESFVPMCGLGSGTQRQLELSTSRSTASDSPNVTHSALIVSCGRSCLILGTPRTDFRGSSQLPGASNEDGTSTLPIFGGGRLPLREGYVRAIHTVGPITGHGAGIGITLRSGLVRSQAPLDGRTCQGSER